MRKFKILPHSLHQKAHFGTQKPHFLTKIGSLIGQFFIRTGAMHPLVEIDWCKCTRCTRTAATPELNTALMLKFIGDLQKGQMVSESIPQFRLIINSVTKQINSKEVKKHYKNFCNPKRWYNPDIHESKLFDFGTTHFEASFPECPPPAGTI